MTNPTKSVILSCESVLIWDEITAVVPRKLRQAYLENRQTDGDYFSQICSEVLCAEGGQVSRGPNPSYSVAWQNFQLGAPF